MAHFRMFVMKKILAASILFLFCSLVLAQETEGYRADNPGFFDKKAEWWFWYRDPALEEPEEKEEKPEEPKVAVKPPKEANEPKAATTQDKGPQVLSTAWLSVNLETYRQKAMDDPTEENVSLYWWLERVAKDRADRFTQVTKKVFYKDWLLNEDSRRPWSDGGQRLFDERRREASRKIMDKISSKFGLFYFFSSDCVACKDIDSVIKSLESKYGFTVIPVSMDGKGIEGGFFPEFETDKGQAEVLGVERLPTVFLARPPNQFVKLTEGFMPMTELGQVMILMAEDQGWITKEEYSATLPYNNLLVDPDLQLPPETEIDPKEMVELIRRNVKRY